MIKYTTNIFIKKAREKHGNKYDYSKVKYVNYTTKVCIICPDHGEFWQTPANHLNRKGCVLCGRKQTTIKRSSNTEEFITKAREKHGNKYDYSKVEYINNSTKICIICSEHGEFEQTPGSHLRGSGCPKCAIEQNADGCRMSQEEFISRAKEIHGDRYDYSKVKYVNRNTKVIIICPVHGEFEQKPGIHLMACGCPICAGNQLMNTEEFIKKAREIHNDKYDYSKVNYVNNHTKVIIICPEHGEFEQTPGNHLSGQGCPTCVGNQLLSTKEFIKRAIEKHGNKYDYSKVKYVNAFKKVIIICPEHGEFEQTPGNHLFGQGCPKCANDLTADRCRMTTEEFISKAREKHDNKYDYSKVKYVNSTTKVCIICPIHGEFEQAPSVHLIGCGCPKCIQTKLEKEVETALKNNNIEFILYYKPVFLKTYKGHSQHLDFFIPSKNIGIECQGIQHYIPVEIFGGEVAFKKRKKYDHRKKELCQKNSIKLLYYTSDAYKDYDGFDSSNTFTDLNELLNVILSI